MRKNKNKAYVVAFLISLFLFVSGIMVGYLIQSSVSKRTENKLNELESKMEDIQLHYTYLNVADENACKFNMILLDEATKELWNISKELKSFENKVSKEEIGGLENKYFLLSAKSWILSSYLNENCERTTVPILYFYSIPCEDCEKQGGILDSVQEKELKNQINVFAMNVNSNEKIVQSMKKTYNVSTEPSLIIDGQKYEGLVSEEDLIETISDSLNN